MKNPIIETERLIIREFVLDDYKAVFEFGSNKEVQKYTGNDLLTSPEQAKEIIKNVWFKDYKTYGFGRWATIYKPDNKLIGFTGLKYLPEFDEVDLGYRYLPEYWGKGIATEASKAVLKYGFECLNLNRIIGITMLDNSASSRVLEKIGFSFYKQDDYDGDGILCNWYEVSKSKFNVL